MGPFIKSKNKTSKIMINLLISLIPIILFSFYKNGYIPYKNGTTSFIGMFYPLLFILVGVLSSSLIEEIYMYVFSKKRGKELIDNVLNSYSFLPGLFICLVLPINTPLSIVFLACLFAIILGKMVFGGFGNNIFNPALVGVVIVLTCFGTTISSYGGYLNSFEIDTISTSTPLTNVSMVSGIGTYDLLVKPYGSLWNFFIGTIPGAVGETSALLCIVAFIYLALTKTIKWRIPASYILTVFGMTIVIGYFNNLGMWYPLFQVLSGGLLFGSVFMATDPVTSPVNKESQILYGIILGILTVGIRYLTNYPEGVLTSILLMNMFVFIIDRWGAKVRFKPLKFYFGIIFTILIAFTLSFYISTTYTRTPDVTDPNYEIISREDNGNETTYIVSQKGFGGKIKATIVFREGILVEMNINDHSESEDRYKLIEDANYISTLKKNQDEIDKVDTISSATITSSALKKMVKNTINDFKNIEVKEEVEENHIRIIDVIEETRATIYTVEIDNDFGTINMTITAYQGDIKSIRLNSYSDTCMTKKDTISYYKCPIYLDEGYINNLLRNQNDVDKVDTISGVTISTKSLKTVVKELKEGTR